MEIVNIVDAPAAIGTYSQAVKTQGLLFISGQIGLDPKTMEMVSSDFAVQARQVFSNLKALALAGNTDLCNTVKLTVYLKDLSCFSDLNDIMGTFFSKPYPARAALQVSGLPKQALIEVDAIVAIPES